MGFVVFLATPILASAFYSLTDFNLFQAPEFVGLDNYRRLLEDDRFNKAVFNTLYLTVIGVPLSLLLALGVAIVLNLPVKGQPLFRAVVYLPAIVPVVVSTYVWRWLLNAQYGYINTMLGWFGLPQPLWLQDPGWTKPAILVIGFWMVGGTSIIYLAALQGVPTELREAARVDGAGPVARFRHVDLPFISPVTLFQVIVMLIISMQVFTQPFLLAQTRLNSASGGPDDSLLTYSMYIFQNAFGFLKMGYASAMAWVLFLATMLVTSVILWTSKRWVHYD